MSIGSIPDGRAQPSQVEVCPTCKREAVADAACARVIEPSKASAELKAVHCSNCKRHLGTGAAGRYWCYRCGMWNESPRCEAVAMYPNQPEPPRAA